MEEKLDSLLEVADLQKPRNREILNSSNIGHLSDEIFGHICRLNLQTILSYDLIFVHSFILSGIPFSSILGISASLGVVYMLSGREICLFGLL